MEIGINDFWEFLNCDCKNCKKFVSWFFVEFWYDLKDRLKDIIIDYGVMKIERNIRVFLEI